MSDGKKQTKQKPKAAAPETVDDKSLDKIQGAGSAFETSFTGGINFGKTDSHNAIQFDSIDIASIKR